MKNRSNLTASPIGAAVFVLPTYFYDLAVFQEYYFWAVFAGLLQSISLYYLASRFQRSAWGEFFRGGLIGANVGFNALLLFYFTGSLDLAVGAGVLVFLSSFLFISRNGLYHPVLGWLNLILPMSWLVSAPGLIIYLVNVIFAPIGYLHPLLRGLRVRFHTDWRTCTFTQYGGLIRPISGFAGLNMGNFIFINHGWEHLLKHEIGHLFSLAAMGWIFHYVGGIDESYLQARYWEAYAEYLAESYNEPEASGLSMWR